MTTRVVVEGFGVKAVADVVVRRPVVERGVLVDKAVVGTTLLNTVRVVGANVWKLAIVVECKLGEINAVVSIFMDGFDE